MAKFGGHMTVKVSTGTSMRFRGEFTERPSSLTAETVVNQDGSLSKTLTNRPYGFAATIVDEGQNFDTLLLAEDVDVTVVEDDTGRTILYSGGHFSGDPSIDRLTGAVTGLTFDATSRRVA